MPDAALRVQRTYLVLTLFTTLAASFIWGINTLFLLSAGLDNTQAFAANAFFTVGPGAVRGPDGRRRGHARPAVLVPARDGDAARRDGALPRDVGHEGRPPRLGDRVDPPRARLHVLLRRHRGVARRRARRHRLSRHARADLRPRPDRDGRRDAHGIGRRRVHRPGHEPRRPVRPARGAARRDVRDRLRVHARHRVHPEPWRERRGGGQRRAEGLDRRRAPQPARSLADAVGPVHGGRRDLRLLRDAAVPAAAVRRPDRVRHRRARGGGRRGRADRRRPQREPRAAVLPPAHRRPPPGGGRHGRPARAHRPDRPVRPGAAAARRPGR